MDYLDAFDRTKPILHKTKVPDFDKSDHPELAKAKYYAKEDERYREGVGEYFDCCGARVRLIPGSLYFGVQNAILKNRQSGKLEEYKAKDVALVTHQHIRESFIKKKISLILKPRGSGFSSDVAGVLPAWIWRTHPGASVVMTSKDSKTSQALYNDKLRVLLQNCPKEIFDYRWTEEGGNKLKETTTGNITVIFQSSYIDNGIIRQAESELFCRETSQTPESASAFASKGAMLGVVDEFFLHKRFDALMDSMINLFQNPNTGEMEGYAVCGGVLEHSVQAKELQGLLEIWDSAEAMGYNKLFIPCWMGKHCNDNGWSDKERYMRYYEDKIAELSKLEDTSKLIAFKKNNPRDENDVRDLASGLDFEPDIVELIKEQIIRVESKPPEIKTGIILKLPDEKTGIDHVVFKEQKEGSFFILEEPKAGVLYNLTMDSTATGSLVSQEIGSKACTLVIKMADPENPKTSYRVVGGYWERPKTVELSYIYTHRLIDYYNVHGGVQKLSPEANASASEFLSAYMKKEGLTKFIAWNKGKPFCYVTGDYRTTQFFRANSFLRKYVQNIDYLPLLKQMISPVALGKKDILASWLMFFFVLKDNFDKPVLKEPEQEMIEVVRWNENIKRNERVWVSAFSTKIKAHGISDF